MKKAISKLLFLMSLFLLYLVVKESISFFESAFAIHSTVGYAAVTVISVLILWFILIPFIKLLLLPRIQGPVTNKADEEKLIMKRIVAYSKNPVFQITGYTDDTSKSLRERYGDATSHLKAECDQIRGRHIRSLFISTSISQNGFLDALLIFSHSIRIIKETFMLYAGRVSLRDLFNITKKVYYSVVIAGSESVEYLSGELLSAVAPNLIKAIPILGKVTESMADGLVNVILLTRISLLTENYCCLTLIEKESDLYPKYKTILSVAKHFLIVLKDKMAVLEDDQISRDIQDEMFRLRAEERIRKRKDLVGCLIWSALLVGGVVYIIIRFASM